MIRDFCLILHRLSQKSNAMTVHETRTLMAWTVLYLASGQNYRWVTQSMIAKNIGLEPTHVCRAFKGLVNKGILIKKKGIACYNINPKLYKGLSK